MSYRLSEGGGRMRRHSSRTRQTSFLSIIVIGCLCLLIIYFSYHIFFSDLRLDQSVARDIVSLAMPTVGEQEEFSPGWSYTARSLIYLLTDFDLGNPESLLENGIPFLSEVQRYQVWEERPFVFIPELSFPPDPVRPYSIESPKSPDTGHDRDPQVLIYHTHSSEMYLGTQAAVRNRDTHYVFNSSNDSTITGVMEVGNHLANALRKQGVSVVHETKIHDWPSLTGSYVNSERTARETLNRYPSIDFVFDVHRDAGVPDPVVQIGGQRVARVLLVLGTAQDIPQTHPDWGRNLEFAQLFYRIAETKYPGLMRPMQVRRDARYNQHLHHHSVILEIGTVENTIEEALLAAELIATVVADMLTVD